MIKNEFDINIFKLYACILPKLEWIIPLCYNKVNLNEESKYDAKNRILIFFAMLKKMYI